MAVTSIWSLICVFAVLIFTAEGIMFHLQVNTQKCLREEIHKDVLVSGEYEVQEAPGQKVDIQVITLNLYLKYIFQNY